MANLLCNGLEYSIIYLFCFNDFHLKEASISQLLKYDRVADLLCAHVT